MHFARWRCINSWVKFNDLITSLKERKTRWNKKKTPCLFFIFGTSLQWHQGESPPRQNWPWCLCKFSARGRKGGRIAFGHSGISKCQIQNSFARGLNMERTRPWTSFVLFGLISSKSIVVFEQSNQTRRIIFSVYGVQETFLYASEIINRGWNYACRKMLMVGMLRRVAKKREVVGMDSWKLKLKLSEEE